MRGYLFLISGVLMSFSCSRNFSPVDAPGSGGYVSPVHLSKAAQQVVASGNQFGFSLFQETIRQQPVRNVFISPLSAAMALAMACNGARTETEQEMRSLLGYGNRFDR